MFWSLLSRHLTRLYWLLSLGNILAERTDTAMGTKKSGSLSRKLQAAMKALGDFTVLTDWIKEQVDIDIENPALRPAEHEKYVCKSLFCFSAFFGVVFFAPVISLMRLQSCIVWFIFTTNQTFGTRYPTTTLRSCHAAPAVHFPCP
jgi:hypothetical protein